MADTITHETLHRTAKYFMDSGKAASAEDALALLDTFAVTVHIDDTTATTVHGQTALLSFVNLARRTFLGGVEVVGRLDVPTIGRLMPSMSLVDAVKALGGLAASSPTGGRPCIIIGDGSPGVAQPAWRLHWSGWSGGVIPAEWPAAPLDQQAMALTPALAAAFAVSEAFAYFAGDHQLAGRRACGLCLWNFQADWLADNQGPRLRFLPSRLWLLGLGNLGQAYAWSLATLPYRGDQSPELVLQDFDHVGVSNDSTSLLSSPQLVGRKKTRAVADWLDDRGFTTVINELRFNSATKWSPDDPGVALCGVDNLLVRSQLDGAGFPLVVEAGLGAGPQAFRSIAIHTLPASRPSAEVWRDRASGTKTFDPSSLPAYSSLKDKGLDDCGLAQLASRTVGVPFVGLIAATMVIAEMLRRLHGGRGVEVASLSTLAPDAADQVRVDAPVYAHGYVDV
ncbi:hypothetical protein [Phenylobacterium sp. SCN 70-31]|uniref:hypothetical protein n=1 Tax=Phenylobacterium sp. SCN 70-31 TaxID=1660129 RepID=UPI00086EA964|nr:hypothetical protein [Phenylobacterium sp. SCN 70-31]ODT89055.1 MAG: hypothetical protein ABS78_02310 [Phenylobacterium sp. SCN 70-31]